MKRMLPRETFDSLIARQTRTVTIGVLKQEGEIFDNNCIHRGIVRMSN